MFDSSHETNDGYEFLIARVCQIVDGYLNVVFPLLMEFAIAATSSSPASFCIGNSMVHFGKED